MSPFNATVLERSPTAVEDDSDIGIFQKYGIPGASLRNNNDKYYWYHHTEGDSMDLEDPTNLDLGTSLFAASAYIVADLGTELPRTDNRMNCQ